MSYLALRGNRGNTTVRYRVQVMPGVGTPEDTGRLSPEVSMTTRQYARLVSEWIGSVGLDPRLFGMHSLRRTKATPIYRCTGNLRAVQLLLGHTKIESLAKPRLG
jgi:integrase